MVARPQMDFELTSIMDELVEMADHVQAAVVKAVESLKVKDSELARQIIDEDEKIDDMEVEISDKCVKFLATQQPVAGDLREILAVMQIIRDLERIGDHCEGIAKYTIRFEQEVLIKELIDLPRMAEMSSKMVRNAVAAFINKDLRLARKVWKADEEVDELFSTLYDEQLMLIDKDPTNSKQCIMFLFIASHLERIADYATNVCEQTVFALEGSYEMENGTQGTEPHLQPEKDSM